jgi:hypothetical protein
MKLFLLKSIVLFLCLPVLALAGEIVSISEYQNEKLSRQFLGNYSRSSYAGNDDAVVAIQDGWLQLYYVFAGNHAACSFSIDLKTLGQNLKTTRRTTRGNATVENESDIVGDEAIKVETITANRWKSIERETLRVVGNEVINKLTRVYYRKKYVWFGPWIEDTTSFDGRRNALNTVATMLRLSATPTPLEDFFASLWLRSPVLIRVGSATSGDNLRDLIARGDFEIVPGNSDPHPVQSSQDSKVIQFPSAPPPNCQSSLE